tara:strand:+ start:1890 stop:2561 length:672 start_codon:yes stop_codon:yes gene_type:complete
MKDQTFVLGVFVKNWFNLPVKTRLARSLGTEMAKDVYHEMVKILSDTLQVYSNMRVVWCVAGGLEGLSSILGENAETVEQSTGDLGQRMGDFCKTQFNLGAKKVLIIGTDSLYLDGSDFDLAVQWLEAKRLVFQPSPDGGYTLVGMNQYTPEVFDSMPWSQTYLMETTINKMQDLDFSFELLGQRNDIDTLEDLCEWFSYSNKYYPDDRRLSNLNELCSRVCM